MYGAFVWARSALNRPKRRFLTRVVNGGGSLSISEANDAIKKTYPELASLADPRHGGPRIVWRAVSAVNASDPDDDGTVTLGLGRIVALRSCSSDLYQIH